MLEVHFRGYNYGKEKYACKISKRYCGFCNNFLSLSTKIDALLYPTVTVATTNTGYLIDDDDDTYYDPQGGNTLIPTSSIHNGEVYYVIKNTDGNYIVAKKQIDILNQNGLYTEITREDTGFLAIIDSDKDLKVGEQVLVKADVLW